MWSDMFLTKSLGTATLNSRRLLVFSLIISFYVQCIYGEDSGCGDIRPNSTAVCESDTIVFAADDGKNDTNATDIDENNVTVNDLSVRNKNDRFCAPVGVIYARGTTEPGNVGILTGPSFFDALDDKLENNDLAIQGVNYPASITGYLIGGSPEGAAEMARLITESRENCPDMHLIVSGYSQGCQVVHRATDQLSSRVTRGIGAIVMFGDPLNGAPIRNYNPRKVLTICHRGDKICDGKPIVLPSHLTYSRDAHYAADFAMNTLARKGIRGYDHTYCKHCGDFFHPFKPWHKYRPYHKHPYFYRHGPHHFHRFDDESSSSNATEGVDNIQPDPEDANNIQPGPEDANNIQPDPEDANNTQQDPEGSNNIQPDSEDANNIQPGPEDANNTQ
ncbi:putative cutinase 5, partial [Erysiphe neolycopersici]